MPIYKIKPFRTLSIFFLHLYIHSILQPLSSSLTVKTLISLFTLILSILGVKFYSSIGVYLKVSIRCENLKIDYEYFGEIYLISF